MNFTIFDIATLSIIIISAVFGLYKGGVRILIGFLSFLASIWLAYILYPTVNIFFAKHISHEVVLSFTSGAISLFISAIIFSFISSGLINILTAFTGGMIDKSLGFAIGVVRGIFICMIIFLVVGLLVIPGEKEYNSFSDTVRNMSTEQGPGWLKGSVMAEYIERANKFLFSILPDNIWIYDKDSSKQKQNKDSSNQDGEVFDLELNDEALDYTNQLKDGSI